MGFTGLRGFALRDQKAKTLTVLRYEEKIAA